MEKQFVVTNRLFITGLLSITLAACGGSGGGSDGGKVGSSESVKASSAVKTSSVTNTAICPAGGIEIGIGIDQNTNGVLDDSEINDTETVCHGTNGSSGTNGSNGLNSMIEVVDEEAGANCSNAGVRISVGLDSDSDNILGAAEISNMKYVCHGTLSSQGQNGLSSLIESTDEVLASECVNGGIKLTSGLDENNNSMLDPDEIKLIELVCNGLNGLDGVNSLIATTIEAAGANCASGGARFDSGLDSNYNGVLDQNEIDSSEYLCHGSQGLQGDEGASGLVSLVDTIPENAGINCPEGGVQVVTGLDADSNNILDVEERTNNAYVCHGIDPGGVACMLSDGINGGKVLKCGNDELYVELPPVYTDPEITEIVGGYRIVDNWGEGSGRYSGFDPRNPSYVFDVTVTGDVVFGMAASGSISDKLILLDQNRVILDSDAEGTQNLDVGTYTLVATSNVEGSIGNFDIDLTGSVSNIRKVAVESFTVSDGWEWGIHSDSDSFLNPQYAFTVDRASDFGFTVNSNEDTHVYITDSNDLVMPFISSNGDGYFTLLDAGDYSLTVTPRTTANNKNFNLRMVGQLSNVAKISHANNEEVGNWISSGGRNYTTVNNPAYSLTITEEGQLDVLLTADQGRYLAILDDLGLPVATQQTSSSGVYPLHLIANLPQGDYTVVVGTYYDGTNGSYRLQVVGQYSDLTQIR